MRPSMQKFLYQTEDAGFYQPADAGLSISDSRCKKQSDSDWCRRQKSHRSLSIRQRMQDSLYRIMDAGLSLTVSRCRRHSMRPSMQKFLYQTAYAGFYQPVDAGLSISDSRCKNQSDSNVGHFLEDRRCSRYYHNSEFRNLSIRQRMQDSLYLTASWTFFN